ncbi:hypothetical protein AY599_27495 [Leptolyngbya valderiana BDU 20041]|nr:hypothetical protein AY599_27495 [Leptolyngbya valderiana BDU 20041]
MQQLFCQRDGNGFVLSHGWVRGRNGRLVILDPILRSDVPRERGGEGEKGRRGEGEKGRGGEGEKLLTVPRSPFPVFTGDW